MVGDMTKEEEQKYLKRIKAIIETKDKFEIEWEGPLLSKLVEGLKNGMWFQRYGEKFFVPAENISARLSGSYGHVTIYFHSDNPCTIASYNIITYGKRWALRKEDLKDIYEGDDLND